MKRAIRLRAAADCKACRYAVLLQSAMAAGDAAALVCNELNQVYNQNISTQTILMHTVLDNTF